MYANKKKGRVTGIETVASLGDYLLLPFGESGKSMCYPAFPLQPSCL